MPATRDGKLWRSQFYYKDWQGVRRKKNKRGFIQKEKQMNGKETFFSNSRRIWISVLRIL